MHGMLEAQHTHGHHLNHTRTPARGPSGTDGPLIKQQPERNYRCQLIEKVCPFYRGKAPLPAYQASLPPSNPLQPRVEVDLRRMCLRQLLDLFRSDRAAKP